MRGVVVTPCALPAPHEATAERVELVRDELGNIVWGTELSGEDALGARWQRRREPPPAPPPGISIAPPPADGSIPFRRVRRGGGVWLARTSVEGAPEPRTAGVLLRSPFVADEEVPAEGLQLARLYRYARSADGRTRLWTTNVRRLGRSIEPPGYAFDLLRR
jgi:hypothetical protein